MKFSITLIALCLVLNVGAQQKFTLTGTIPSGYNGKKIALIEYDDCGNIVSRESKNIEDGKFAFEGHEYLDGLSRLVVSNDNGDVYAENILFLERGDIKIDVKGHNSCTVIGTPLNDLYQIYLDSCQYYGRFIQKAREASPFYNPSSVFVERGSEFHKLNDDYGRYSFNFKKDNFSNPVGRLLLIEILGENTGENIYINWNEKPIEELFTFLDKETMEHPKIKKYFADKEKDKQTAEWIESFVGKQFADIDMIKPNGENGRISEYLSGNKYIFLDFWASWCSPCLSMIPALTEVYNKYHDAGLEIVGVSIDEKASDWTAMLEKKSLPWPQLKVVNEKVDELKKEYGIKGIPHGVLIDNQGKIVIFISDPTYLDATLAEKLK